MLAGRMTDREAQIGNNPWVRGSHVPPGPKGVMVGMPFCAELLRLSSNERVNDRM